jgi:hypothetical protein
MPQRLQSSATKLLIHGDGLVDDWQIKDQCGNSVINTGVTLSTTQKKFGKYSMYFNGSAYLTLPILPSMGSYDFTYHFYMYYTNSQTAFIHADYSSVATNATLYVEIEANDTCYVQFFTSGGAVTIDGNTNIPKNQWNHIALIRNGSSFKVFINGTQDGSTQTQAAAMNTPVYTTAIGRPGEWNLYKFTWYIAEFQILVGQALWTSNFTPPDLPSKGRKGWY